jgi:hypothetical protein
MSALNLVVSASITTRGKITATWKAPPKVNVDNYTVTLKKDVNTLVQTVTTPNTYIDFFNLSIKTLYTVTVKVNLKLNQSLVGSGLKNTALKVIPVTAAITLAPPTVSPSITIILTRIVNNQVTALVSWVPPSTPSGVPSYLQNYTVRATPSTGDTIQATTINSSTTSIYMNGLIEARPYVFTVTANTVSGSSPLSFNSTSTQPKVAGSPTNLIVTPSIANSGQVTLSWTPSPTAPQGYLVQVFNGANLIQSFIATNTTQVISNLNTLLLYTYQVESFVTIGNSLLYSDPISVSYTLYVPSPLSSLTATALNGRNVSLTWPQVQPENLGIPNQFVSYNISAFKNLTTTSVYDVTINVVSTINTVIPNLTPGTDYFFTISVQNTSGISLVTKSNIVTTQKVPDNPTSIMIDPSFEEKESLRIRWIPPVFQGVPPFTGFNLYYSKRPIGPSTPSLFVTTHSFDPDLKQTLYYCDITNEDIDEEYYFKVETVNSLGVSPGVLFGNKLSTPSVPLLVTALAISRTAANVSFYAPSSNGKPDKIINYKILANGTDISFVYVPSAPFYQPTKGGNPKIIEIGGLTAATDYSFNVTASNRSGESPSANTNTITTFT